MHAPIPERILRKDVKNACTFYSIRVTTEKELQLSQRQARRRPARPSTTFFQEIESQNERIRRTPPASSATTNSSGISPRTPGVDRTVDQADLSVTGGACFPCEITAKHFGDRRQDKANPALAKHFTPATASASAQHNPRSRNDCGDWYQHGDHVGNIVRLQHPRRIVLPSCGERSVWVDPGQITATRMLCTRNSSATSSSSVSTPLGSCIGPAVRQRVFLPHRRDVDDVPCAPGSSGGEGTNRVVDAAPDWCRDAGPSLRGQAHAEAFRSSMAALFTRMSARRLAVDSPDHPSTEASEVTSPLGDLRPVSSSADGIGSLV